MIIANLNVFPNKIEVVIYIIHLKWKLWKTLSKKITLKTKIISHKLFILVRAVACFNLFVYCFVHLWPCVCVCAQIQRIVVVVVAVAVVHILIIVVVVIVVSHFSWLIICFECEVFILWIKEKSEIDSKRHGSGH